jgi:HTH-type transcriptional regulator / antitoxin HipB
MADRTSKTLQELHEEWMGDPAYRTAFEQADRAMEIGERVRNLRLALGMSQSDLARKACTSRSAIARIEMGDGDPRMLTLRKVGAALGVELVIELRDPAVA